MLSEDFLRPHNCGSILYPEGLSGERVCGVCGLVLKDTSIFQGYTLWNPEWFSNWGEEDSETLTEWLTILRTVSCQLRVPNFPYREEAARIIRKQKQVLFKSQRLSKNKRATIAALMHFILKEYDRMRPLKEISKELSLDSRSVMKQAWLLNKTLNLTSDIHTSKRKTALNYLHEYGGELTTDNQLIKTAEKTLRAISRLGGNPVGLAAGAFYNSCKRNSVKISKEEIGDAFHISVRTVYINEAKIRNLLDIRKPNSH